MAKKPQPLMLPAIKGKFGSWIFYSCLVPLDAVAKRVHYAEEIYKDKELSKLIQRKLDGDRAANIAQYLKNNEDRFFSSLVLATHGGEPKWLEIETIGSKTAKKLVDEISEETADSLGYLRLSGDEQLFAVDGQHRVAGIRKAVAAGLNVDGQSISVLIVGHRPTSQGRQRTRRLFTTLNKTAVAVKKSDIIALDEDDVMAITVRRLIEENSQFKSPKIAVIAGAALPPTNTSALTTIVNLYDVLKILFKHTEGLRSDKTLRFNRPTDEELTRFYGIAKSYFGALSSAFPVLGSFFESETPATIVKANRNDKGGHLLFRPIGLDVFTRAVAAYDEAKGKGIADAVKRLKKIPTELSAAPFKGVIWDNDRQTVLPKGKPLAVDLIAYMIGLKVDVDDLRAEYRKAVGNSTAQLPSKIS